MPSLGLTLSLRGNLLNSGAAPAFSPTTLFASAEPGVWYDPSDLTTLFTDTAGTTPVTAPGQTVALALDKSKGLVLGPELLGNPSFTSSANYNLFAGATISGGQLFIDNQTNSRAEGSGNFIPAGKWLQVEVDIASTTGSIAVLLADNTGALVLDAGFYSSSGTSKRYVFSSNTNGNFRIIRSTGATVINSISFRELPGFHATQATLASRPTYAVVPATGRRNLLTFTEQFDNAVWTKFNTTVSATQVVAPDGTTTADPLFETTTTAGHGIYAASGATVNGQASTVSVYIKPNGRNFAFLRTSDTTGVSDFHGVSVDLVNGTATSAVGSPANISCVSAPNGFFRVSFSFTAGVASSRLEVITSTDGVYANRSYAGDVTKGLYLWGAQLELGSTATAYQRVGTAFDVTEAGVQSLSYLSFDGIDDFLVTPTITPGVDKVQVFAGVRKLSDAATGIVAELSDSASNFGAFTVSAPNPSLANSFGFFSRGSLTTGGAVFAAFPAPITSVITGLGDISGDLATLRVNGTQAAQSTGDQGTGNYLAYPLYIGRRAGTSAPFNGHLYSLIVRFGANLDAATITSTESWTGGKTGLNWANIISPTIFARDDTAVLDRFDQTIERRAT
jgi:hypothetical protein